MRLGFAALLSLLVVAVPSVAHAQIEDYASYDGPQKCHAKPRAGTDYLGHWVARHFGGGYVGYGRQCDKSDGPTSEHQTGQAFDWSLDATKRHDRRTAKDFFHRIFEKDARGNTDAWARRMGIMYLIWDDEMYPAWNEFRPEPYLSSSCKSKKKCPTTLRHRNHVHVSLDMDGAKGRTSWFEDRL